MPDISEINDSILPSATMEITAKARELKAQGKPVIGFGAGEPDFPTPPYIVEAAKDAAENPTFHKYAQVNGLPVPRTCRVVAVTPPTFKVNGRQRHARAPASNAVWMTFI